MVRAIVLSMILLLTSASLVQAAAVTPVLAQYSSQSDDSSSSNNPRYRTRSYRGVGRLVGLGVVGVLAVGGWIARKIRGE